MAVSKDMNRDEQIIAEAKKHYGDINCHNAFLHGVEWADEHLANVWHEASEEPKSNSAQIIFQDKSGHCWCLSKYMWYICDWDWERISFAHSIVRWAYISDLLPKGGDV